MIDVYTESPGLGIQLGIVIGNAFVYGMVSFRVSECLGLAAGDAIDIGIAGSCVGIVAGAVVATNYHHKQDNII